MSQRSYMIALGVLLLVMIVVRLTLPALGIRGPLMGRLDTVDLATILTIVALTLMVFLRLRDAGMNLGWTLTVFFWLVICRPGIHGLLGWQDRANSTSEVQGWWEIPVMLLVFLLFLAIFRSRATIRSGTLASNLLIVAAFTAFVSIIARPLAAFGGLSALPYLGEPINFSGDTLTSMLKLEQGFTAAKSIFTGDQFTGNLLLVALFTGALILVLLAARGSRT